MSKIETRRIRVAVTREGELCDRWPGCRCTTQGYVNLSETNHCGRKPKTRRVAREEEVES